MTGWSNKGGSTTAFIALTKALNEAGFKTALFGPHNWHLDKCQSGLLDSNFRIDRDDKIIVHFLQFPAKPLSRKVLLACHETDLYRVGQVKQFWDEAIFLTDKHRAFHSEYTGKFRVIPNLKENLIKTDKTGLEKIAGIIGSFDENKQTHVSIQRALADGCEKIYLFGEPNTLYYDQTIKPLCNENVIVKGFFDNKQEIYDMIGCVYHSSLSETYGLVMDECESTGTIYHGCEATNRPSNTLTNEQIITKWIKALKP